MIKVTISLVITVFKKSKLVVTAVAVAKMAAAVIIPGLVVAVILVLIVDSRSGNISGNADTKQVWQPAECKQR